MDEPSQRLAALEARVEELARRIDALEGAAAQRAGAAVEVAEPAAAGPAAPAAAGPAPMEVPAEPVGGHPSTADTARPVRPAGPPAGPGTLALVGRTLMVLGGAYLFRALTESGTVPPAAGLLLGLGYAFVWLLFADRAAAAGRARSAAFHGASFAIIAEPLAWEAAGRFGAVGAVGGAAGVLLFTACALWVAWRRRLRSVAWIAVLAAIFAAWALMASIEPLLPAAAVLVLVAAAADWLAEPLAGSGGWRGVAWPAALAADVTVAAVATEALFGQPEPPEVRLAVGLLLLGLFVLAAGSSALRALLTVRGGASFGRRPDRGPVGDDGPAGGPAWRPRWLELGQVPAATVIGYGGAVVAMRSLVADPGAASEWAAVVVGAASVVAAAGCYALARPLLAARPASRPAYMLVSGLGLVLALGAAALLLPAAGMAVAWAALAVAAAWASGRWGTVTLGLHAFAFAILAAVASGLLVEAALAFWAEPSAAIDGRWPHIGVVDLLVLGALAVGSAMRLPVSSSFWGPATRLPKLLLLAALVWGAAGAALAVLVPGVLGRGGPPDPALVAAVRTATVALVALGLAWAGRLERFREARWLAYAVLAAGAVKLVVEDLRLGSAGELFFALALYGGALIVTPWLGRGDGD